MDSFSAILTRTGLEADLMDDNRYANDLCRYLLILTSYSRYLV